MADDVSGKVGLDTTDWKTGVSQINRDVRTIESGFRVVAAGMDNWKTSADGLAARQDALSQIIEKQRSKVDLLEAEYKQMKDAAAANGDESERTAAALQEFEIRINKAKEQLAKSEKEFKDNAQAIDKMGDESKDTAKEVKQVETAEKSAEKQTKNFGSALKSAASFLGGAFVTAAKAAAAAAAAIGAALVGAATKAFDFAKDAGTMADNVLTLSSTTGISTKNLQQWGYACNFIDTPLDTITGSMTKLTSKMASGSDGFKKLGISTKNADGSLRRSEDVFWDCIDALGGIDDETQRDVIAMELFGKSAKDLNPLIEAGSDGFKSMGKEAEEMGVVFSEDALAAMGSFDDSMQRANATATGLKNAIGLTVIPAFQPLVDAATGCMATISLALHDGLQPEDFETITTAISTLISTAMNSLAGMVTGALPFITQGLTTLATSIAALLPGMIETLTPAALSILTGLVGALTANVEPLTNCAVSLINSLSQFLIASIPTLATAAISIIQGLVTGLTGLLPSLIPAAISMIVQLAVSLIQAIPVLAASLPAITQAIIDGLAAVDWIATGTTIITAIISGLGSLGESLLLTVATIASNILTGLTTTDWSATGKAIITAVCTGLGSLGETLGTTIATVATTIYNGITGTDWAAVGSSILTLIGTALAAIPETFVAAVATVGASIMAGITGIDWGSVGSGIISAILTGLTSLGETILTKAGSVATSIAGAITGTDWGAIGKGLIDGVVNGMSGMVETAKEKVTGFFSSIWGGVKSFFGIHSPSTLASADGGNVVKGFTQGAEGQKSTALEKVKSVFSAIWNGIKSIFGFGGGTESADAKKAGKDVTQAVADGISGGGEEAKKAVKSTASTILSYFKTELGVGSGASTKTKPFGADTVKGLVDGMSGKKSDAEKGAKEIGEAAVSKMGDATGAKSGASTKTKPFGENLVTGLANGINGKKNDAEKAGDSVGKAAADKIKSATNESTTKPYGKNAVQGVINGLNDMKNTLKTNAESVGKAVASGIATGITNGAASINKAAKDAANAALKAAKDTLGIHSPSRVMAEQVGLPSVQGIAEGITSNTRVLTNAMNDATHSMADGLNVKPVALPAAAARSSAPTVVHAVLTLREKQFGDLVVQLADKGQGFSAANTIRHDLGVQLA